MCNLKAIYDQIKATNLIKILDKDYPITNCTIATDGEILKLNAYLTGADSSLTISIELENFNKK